MVLITFFASTICKLFVSLTFGNQFDSNFSMILITWFFSIPVVALFVAEILIDRWPRNVLFPINLVCLLSQFYWLCNFAVRTFQQGNFLLEVPKVGPPILVIGLKERPFTLVMNWVSMNNFHLFIFLSLEGKLNCKREISL